MTLKERLLSEKPVFSKEDFEKAMNSKDAAMYDKFLDICERLEKNIDDNTCCTKSEDVFNEIEKRNIYIFDIISKRCYDELKKYILESKVQSCPIIGKEPGCALDLNKYEDCLEYMRIHGRGSF